VASGRRATLSRAKRPEAQPPNVLVKIFGTEFPLPAKPTKQPTAVVWRAEYDSPNTPLPTARSRHPVERDNRPLLRYSRHKLVRSMHQHTTWCSQSDAATATTCSARTAWCCILAPHRRGWLLVPANSRVMRCL